jgi:nucleoside-diphosphate-sugar epimerase
MARVLVAGGCGTISANVLGAMRLLDLLVPGGKFAYTSTSEVYGDPSVSPHPESYRGSVDCGNDREIAVLDVARFVANLFGGLPIVHLDPVPQDPSNRCPDLTLAQRVLPGWKCNVPYEEGVARTADWFSEQAASSNAAAAAAPAEIEVPGR